MVVQRGLDVAAGGLNGKRNGTSPVVVLAALGLAALALVTVVA